MFRRIAAAGGTLAIVAAVLVSAAPAQAHNYLVSSTPAANSTITELPATFSVTTNEALLDLTGDGSGFAIEVVDAAGLYYGDGCVSIVDATLSTGAALGEAGDYRLVWQLVSADGHTVSGEFGFTWDPAADAVRSPGSVDRPNCGGVATPAPVVTAVPQAHPAAQLGDVLWIGGAIVAVLVAALVTFLVATRKKA